MNTGMLWFDNDAKRPLSDKISLAVSYYKNKYKREPNLCLIHPSMLPEPLPEPKEGKEATADEHTPLTVHDYGITVRPYRPVLPGHLWIGVEDKDA